MINFTCFEARNKVKSSRSVARRTV
uniref:Uncharacterized protein n=1 Tax=Arundo donax TaxID=35708 RepID=A0A0A8Z3J3_ARUDO